MVGKFLRDEQGGLLAEHSSPPSRARKSVGGRLTPGADVCRHVMGRIFETRKATMFARWNKMAKIFTRITKDITIAVKTGGKSNRGQFQSQPSAPRSFTCSGTAGHGAKPREAAVKALSSRRRDSKRTMA
jgi:hypothetical protein